MKQWITSYAISLMLPLWLLACGHESEEGVKATAAEFSAALNNYDVELSRGVERYCQVCPTQDCSEDPATSVQYVADEMSQCALDALSVAESNAVINYYICLRDIASEVNVCIHQIMMCDAPAVSLCYRTLEESDVCMNDALPPEPQGCFNESAPP